MHKMHKMHETHETHEASGSRPAILRTTSWLRHVKCQKRFMSTAFEMKNRKNIRENVWDNRTVQYKWWISYSYVPDLHHIGNISEHYIYIYTYICMLYISIMQVVTTSIIEKSVVYCFNFPNFPNSQACQGHWPHLAPRMPRQLSLQLPPLPQARCQDMKIQVAPQKQTKNTAHHMPPQCQRRE